MFVVRFFKGRSKFVKSFLLFTVLAVAAVFLSVAELGFVENAEAIIGMPWTPLSYAGVARRTMYREAAYSAAVTNAAVMNAAAANAAYANAAAAQAAAANAAAAQAAAANAAAAAANRSEERRVGKGCGSRRPA